jgi:hypothetical protein
MRRDFARRRLSKAEPRKSTIRVPRGRAARDARRGLHASTILAAQEQRSDGPRAK